MIRIEKIAKTFNPHSRNRNQVLKGVSFDLPEKGLVAIFGKSGSGKTTLLNILGGLEKQDGGKIFIDGEKVAGKVDKVRNAKIGFIFQNYYLEKGYTIAEIMRNAMLIAGFKDETEMKRRSEEVLMLVDMERYKNKQGDALSGGQKQRVAIARALIKGADIILADEPTGNLDAQNTVKVMEILKEISKTKLVVLVTHELTLIKNYADSYIEIVDGQIVEDSKLGEAIAYNTEVNNIYIDENQSQELKAGNLAIEVFGEPISQKDTLQIINSNGSLYIKAGKNVTVLDDSSEKRVVFGRENHSEESPERKVPDFAKSEAKRNGRLFTFGSIFRRHKGQGEERFYSTANIFKQVFIAVIAVIMCFFSLASFEVINTTVEHKNIDGNSVYVNMNTYSDLRQLDESLYENVDFFETQYKEGSFSYNEIASLSGIKADYAPRAIEADDTAESVGLVYGEMPELGEALITRDLAETLKKEFRLNELDSNRAMLLVVFEGQYRVSGIAEGDTPAVLLNKQDYINFLGVYNTVSLSDYNNLFLDEEYADAAFTSEILAAKDSMLLENNEVQIEINRNSLYKMMTDVTQADFKVEETNTRLASVEGTSTAIQVTGSKPMYVQKFIITRDVMDTDIRIYVNETAMNNIFVYLQPNLDALKGTTSSMGIESQFYFEVNTAGGEQLTSLQSRLKERGISSVNISAQYESENAEVIAEAAQSLLIFAVITVLLLLIYYFMEKSGSIKNSKEYGIYRAIGVNRSNLLFKEAVTTCSNNILGYLIFYLIAAILMCVRYAVMNVAFGLFVGLLAGVFVVSALLLVGISLIPYLFVLTQSPAQILSRFDI